MSGVSIRTAQTLLSLPGWRNAVTVIPRLLEELCALRRVEPVLDVVDIVCRNHLHGDGPFRRLGPHRPVRTIRRYASGFVDALKSGSGPLGKRRRP